MYTFGQEFARAIERKMAWDVVTSMRQNRRRAHERMHAELVALASGEVEHATDFQQHVQALADECAQPYEALVEVALSPPVDADKIRAAAAELVGGIVGRVVSLEMRVALLEAVLDGR